MARSRVATVHALVLLTAGACTVAGAPEDPMPAPTEGSVATNEPEQCGDPGLRPVCTEIALLGRTDLEATYDLAGEGAVSVDPAGRLRYDATIEAPGDTPGGVKAEYLHALTYLDEWQRAPAPPPYDLKLVGRAAQTDLTTDYEILMDIGKGAGAVRIDVVILTVLPARTIAAGAR